MNLVSTPIAGVVVVETAARRDPRGSFARFYCAGELRPAIGERTIAQINHSVTGQPGTVRGLHFQHAPHAEMKLVRCVRGRVWDVAVDLRAGSSTLLRWHAVELTAANARMLVIPEGCAHGFQTLDPDSELLYLHMAAYAPDAEDGVAWDDPRVAVAWPLPVDRGSALSERDRNLPRLTPDFAGIAA